MLKESKELFKNHADSVLSDWENAAVDDLFNKYLKASDNKVEAEAYLSAIIYKSWHLVTSAYSKQYYKIATEQDCYDTLINSIQYLKDKHPWTEGEGSLADDDNAFAKALSHSYKQGMVNFFNSTKKHKRSVNYNSRSLDSLSEDFSEGYLTPVNDDYPLENSYLDDLITKFFDEKNYIYSFILDAILNLDIFTNTKINSRKLRKHLRNLDADYCRIFCDKYNIDFNKAEQSLKYITGISQFKMDSRINKVIQLLGEDKFIRKYYLGGIK